MPLPGANPVPHTANPNAHAIVEAIARMLEFHPEAEAELSELLSLKYGRQDAALLTAKEFALSRRVDADTASKWARSGRIPAAKKVGREWRIPENAEVLEAGDLLIVDVVPIGEQRQPRRRARSSAAQAMRSQARTGRTPNRYKEKRHERAA